jgi:hypothetical protein
MSGNKGLMIWYASDGRRRMLILENSTSGTSSGTSSGTGSGGIAIGIPPAIASTGTVYFSNANGVTFGINAGQTITASVNTGGSVNFSAGATSNNLGSVVFSNSNGLSFGLNGSTITGSYTVPVVTNSSATISAGTQSTIISSIVFSNSNGLAFGLSNNTITGSYTVPTVTNSSWTVSASASSQTVSQLVFSNSNNFTFGLSAGTITGSYTVPTLTNSSWTVSDSATSGTVARLAFTNLNGVTLSLSSGTGGLHTIVGSVVTNYLTSQSNQALSGSNGSFTFQTATFGNLNGLSFYTSNGSMVGSYTVPSETPFAISAGTQSVSTGTVSFANSNGITFGMSNSNVITASYSTNEATLSYFDYPSQAYLTNQNQVRSQSIYINHFVLPQQLTATVADIFASVQMTTSAANNSTYSGTFTYSVGLYTMNAGTLSRASSGSQSFSYSYTSNISTSVISGLRKFTVPINVNATPGNYWYAVIFNIATGSGSITQSFMGGGTDVAGQFSGGWGQSRNISNQLFPYMGVYSTLTTAFPASINVSEIYAGSGGATSQMLPPIFIGLRNISTAP